MYAAKETPAIIVDSGEKGQVHPLRQWASKVRKALDEIVPSFKPVLLCLTVIWFIGALSIGMRPRTLIEPIEVAPFVRTVFSIFKWSAGRSRCRFNRGQHREVSFIRGLVRQT